MVPPFWLSFDFDFDFGFGFELDFEFPIYDPKDDDLVEWLPTST